MIPLKFYNIMHTRSLTHRFQIVVLVRPAFLGEATAREAEILLMFELSADVCSQLFLCFSCDSSYVQDQYTHRVTHSYKAITLKISTTPPYTCTLKNTVHLNYTKCPHTH